MEVLPARVANLEITEAIVNAVLDESSGEWIKIMVWIKF